MLKFAIQTGNPTSISPERSSYEELSSAIQAIFPIRTEDAILFWNHIPVCIEYKYDLSVMIGDVLPLMQALLREERGTYDVTWGSNTFCADWNLKWVGEAVKIKAQWQSVAGNYQDLLNTRPELEVGRTIFLTEWKSLLDRIDEAIRISGIEITEEADGLALLRSIRDAIPGTGQLYQHGPVLEEKQPSESSDGRGTTK